MIKAETKPINQREAQHQIQALQIDRNIIETKFQSIIIHRLITSKKLKTLAYTKSQQIS